MSQNSNIPYQANELEQLPKGIYLKSKIANGRNQKGSKSARFAKPPKVI